MKNKTSSKRNAQARSSVARGWPLVWDEYYKQGDDLVMEAIGGSADMCSGDLHYRLCRTRFGKQKSVWVEASSPELMLDENKPRVWKTKHKALAVIQREHDAIMLDYSTSAHGVLTQEIQAHIVGLAGTSGKGKDYEAVFVAALEHVRDNIMPLLVSDAYQPAGGES